MTGSTACGLTKYVYVQSLHGSMLQLPHRELLQGKCSVWEFFNVKSQCGDVSVYPSHPHVPESDFRVVSRGYDVSIQSVPLHQ